MGHAEDFFGSIPPERMRSMSVRLPWVLASVSPRRAALLRQLGRPFTTVPSDAAEVTLAGLTPAELTQLNAYRKAQAVGRQRPESLVLGADTLVCLGTELFGKPADLEGAVRMLARLQGRAHQVITGVCLVHWAARRSSVFAVASRVTFRTLSESQIRQYLALIDPLDKAGAYAIQEQGDLIVERLAGSFSNVVGLPLERLEVELTAFDRALGQASEEVS